MSGLLDDDPLLQPLKDKMSGGIMLGGVLLKRKVGEGGLGSVYAGLHTRLNLLVAVKILKDASPSNLQDFLREARLTVSIDHPNLVRVLDVNADPHTGLHYIVMEYIEGCSAYEMLTRCLHFNSRPISENSTLEIGIAAAQALKAAHTQEIVHQDVKPDNILVRSRDGVVKLADLGLAKTYSPAARARQSARHIVGTMGFLAPEILSGAPATPGSDIFSLGATLYELCTGKLPFGEAGDQTYSNYDAQNPRTVAPQLGEEFSAIVLRALCRNPRERFADAGEVAALLASALAKRTQTHAARLPSGITQAADLEQPTVLLVDDDAEVVSFLSEALEEAGFRTVCFTSPLDALNSLSGGEMRPDVAVLDLNMPAMDGTQLCAKLRACEGFSDLPALILSGNDREAAINQAMNQGIDDYLIKPARIPEIILRVQLLATLRKTNRQSRLLQRQLQQIKRRGSTSND